MPESLMDCHERELMNLEPVDAAFASSVLGLFLRGFAETGVYATKPGKRIYFIIINNILWGLNIYLGFV